MFSEEKIIKVLRKIKWPKGALCPECGSRRIYTVKDKLKIKKYTCKDCLRRFSDISQTLFQKTRTPLAKWIEAFQMFQKNPSTTARKLKNDLIISYTAARRIRRILENNKDFIDKFLKNLSH
jgi:transposase-like protein